MGEFEWILNFEDLQKYLDPDFLGVPRGGRALVVGCGRSALSQELANRGLFSDVLSIDCDPVVIEAMRNTAPEMRWICADVCSCEGMACGLQEVSPEVAAGGAFDAVVDKGTLDAVLCEDDKAAGLLCECYRALRPGGAYLCVSLRNRSLLDRLLGEECPCDWGYNAFPVPGKNGEAFTVALLRRPIQGGKQPDLGAMRQHCVAASDAFFVGESPLLTAEREAAVCSAFGDADMALADAFQLLFTDVEKEEYKLDDFLEDAAATGTARANSARMNVQEALAFLRENQ